MAWLGIVITLLKRRFSLHEVILCDYKMFGLMITDKMDRGNRSGKGPMLQAY